MAKTLVMVDQDKVFSDLKFPPIMLNDIPSETAEDRKALNALIAITYQDDTIDGVPRCGCGKLGNAYNLGVLHEKCSTRVESPTEVTIESNVWFRAPDGVTAMINPHLWTLLSTKMVYQGYNVLRWMCSPNVSAPPVENKKAHLALRRYERLEIPRGVNSFIANFDLIVPVLLASFTDKYAKLEMEEYLIRFRKYFFPRHLPMPTRMAIIMEETNMLTFVDVTIADAIDAARTMTMGNHGRRAISKVEGKVAAVVNSLSMYYDNLIDSSFSKKEGMFRNVMLGARMPFAFRSVIVSNAGVHDYETTEIPYTTGVTMFKVHIMNLMEKEGWTYREAWDYVDEHTMTWDSYLYGLLMQLVKLSPGGKGLGHLFIRYPTLDRLSIQFLFIVDFTLEAAKISPLAIIGPNADYDGDQLTGIAAQSLKQYAIFEYYRPHYGIFALHKPMTITRNLALPDATIGTTSAWLEYGRRPIDQMHEDGVGYVESVSSTGEVTRIPFSDLYTEYV